MAIPALRSARSVAPVSWGLVVGALSVAVPVALWWLDMATVHSVLIAGIASVYVGFAVADGRPKVIAVESSVALAFVLFAATAVTGSPWLLVAGYFGHGCKDVWQHRTNFVNGTRWWPPFCAAVDWIAAGIIAAMILAGVPFR
jgi:hypothetical protein